MTATRPSAHCSHSDKALAERATRTEVADRLVGAIPVIAGHDEAHVLLWDPGDALLARVASTSSAVPARVEPGPGALRNSAVENRLLDDGDADRGDARPLTRSCPRS